MYKKLPITHVYTIQPIINHQLPDTSEDDHRLLNDEENKYQTECRHPGLAL